MPNGPQPPPPVWAPTSVPDTVSLPISQAKNLTLILSGLNRRQLLLRREQCGRRPGSGLSYLPGSQVPASQPRVPGARYFPF